MATIASGIVCGTVKTNAQVTSLSGWTRKTQLDAKYLASPASAGDSSFTGYGNANHNHTMASHTHNFNGATQSLFPKWDKKPATSIRSTSHSHPSKASNSGSVTIDTEANEYTRIEPIFMVSDGTPTGFPVDSICCFRADSDIATSWTRINSDGFLKGAVASGNGSATQTVKADHTHTNSSHSHASISSSSSSGSTDFIDPIGIQPFSAATHTHTITFTNASITFDNTAAQPAYRTINICRNDTGGDDFPDKVVAWFDGTNANIPTDWAELTDWADKFPRGASADGQSDVDTGGGTAGHAHTQSHKHTVSQASSTTSTNDTTNLTFRRGGGAQISTHTHTWTCGNNTTSSDTSTASAHYPLYEKILLVEYTSPPSASGQVIMVMTT